LYFFSSGRKTYASIEGAALGYFFLADMMAETKVVRHSRKIVFQMAEVAVPRELFRAILERIGRLRLATAMSG
jgi:hypothetical protein